MYTYAYVRKCKAKGEGRVGSVHVLHIIAFLIEVGPSRMNN